MKKFLAIVVLLVIAAASALFFVDYSSFENYGPSRIEFPSGLQVEVKYSSTITGTLSYPSEYYPAMRVCAVNIKDEGETCVETVEGDDSYSLSVSPGTYLVSAQVKDSNLKTYYTKCDTLDGSDLLPECNNNEWRMSDFICHEDAVCKSAYTPLAVEVLEGEVKVLQAMFQGWYIPCSHELSVCNDPSFDVWRDYLPF